MLENYKGFEGAKTVVDVGGGLGTAINLITSKYPHIKGINFDLPHVIQHAPSYPRVQHIGGNMFESIPRGDVIFMKWILHELSDEQCLKLLLSCHKALPKKGKVVVVEAVLPIILWTNFAIRSLCGMDMMTMTQNPEGRERRQMDWLNLATSAGFDWCAADVKLLFDKISMDGWYKLKDAVLEGGSPFDMVHGKKDAFEYSKTDSRFHQIYNKAMLNHTTMFVKEMLEKYKGFEGAKTVVDVGGGLGTAINLITSKYPHIKGINFDLPHVIQHAPSYPRVQHIGGDMFESFPRGDVIFMKWILHELSYEQCLKLLLSCHKALPKKGKVVVVEAVLPIILWTNFAIRSLCGMDMMTMTQNPQGREGRQIDWVNLATSAGFSWVPCAAAFIFNYHPVMEFIKTLSRCFIEIGVLLLWLSFSSNSQQVHSFLDFVTVAKKTLPEKGKLVVLKALLRFFSGPMLPLEAIVLQNSSEDAEGFAIYIGLVRMSVVPK
ncbi:O-methyltransferase domain [Dillenia turbinata]|uniref:O-methyltransferase domain n=1 Tax=Dillenia turbinata TaxID=194707 RepID=A0AAN8WAI4_9MAGN